MKNFHNRILRIFLVKQSPLSIAANGYKIWSLVAIIIVSQTERIFSFQIHFLWATMEGRPYAFYSNVNKPVFIMLRGW